MEALGLNMVGGLKPAVERPSPWPWPWPNRSRRTFGIFACSSSSSSSNPNSNPNSSSSSSEKAKDSTLSSSSFLSRSQTYALLKQQMAVAAKLEDYKEAARIRDSLKSFEAEEPVLRLRGLMKKAIEEEKFEDAARYRDQLKIVAPHAFLRCSSDAVTLLEGLQLRDFGSVVDICFPATKDVKLSLVAHVRQI